MNMSIIDVKNLSYSYPQEKTKVLSNISFKADKGEILGIIGPSGCGKSTLMLTLSGLIPHSLKGDMEGSVVINGKDTKNLTMSELSQNVQILFQSPDSQLFALNVEDEITFGLENLNLPWSEIEKRLEESLNLTDISSLRNNSIEELSSGQKQRVALASILAMKPQILLFDEPTANLDPPSVKHFTEIVKELSKKHTVIIIEHNVELVRDICDRAILMSDGRILKDAKLDEIFKSKEYKKIMLQPHNVNDIIKKIERISSSTENKTILEIKDLNFSYPNASNNTTSKSNNQNNKSKTLSNINLTVGKGDFLGILGLNGSGKSTLALNIIGILRGSGNIILDGGDISRKDIYERTKKIGYVFQNPNYQLFEETLLSEVAFGPINLKLSENEIKKRTEEAIKITLLSKFNEHDPHALSVGQKRRVSIASILSMNPKIIIVDEPDTGLDHKTAKEIMNHFKELNKNGITIIMISHSLELIAEYCNRVVGMKDGNIVNPKEVYGEYLNY